MEGVHGIARDIKDEDILNDAVIAQFAEKFGRHRAKINLRCGAIQSLRLAARNLEIF
jgi:hypothetical protein